MTLRHELLADPKWKVGEERDEPDGAAPEREPDGLVCLCKFAIADFAKHGQHDRRCHHAPPESPVASALPSPVEKRDHFDPNPRPLEPAQNGWLWCEVCQSPQEARGHVCLTPFREMGASMRERAEFAESLLCATVFHHWWAFGGACCCVLCDAARGTT